MKVLKSLRPWLALFCSAVLLVPPAGAHNRAGDKLLKQGQKAEAQHDYDAALTFYEQALETDSKETAYLIAEQHIRPLASNTHVENGKRLLTQQKLNEALVQFNKALLTDPSSAISLQMINQTNAMIKQRDKAPAGAVILTPAEQTRQDLEKRIGQLQGPPVLRPINNQISNLKMNNQNARVLYESVGKLAGINVLFDPQGIEGQGGAGGGTRNFNLNLNDVTLEEALNDVALVTHTFWKPVSRNAIFVTSESDQKRQEYQDEVVRVFYVQNASTTNEFTDIFNAIRTGAKLQTGIFQVASQNAIIARGSPDTMSIIEKLVHDLDRPKAEVMVDIMVLEVSKSNILNLGATLTGTAAGNAVNGIGLPISPGTSTTSSSSGTSTTTTTGTSIPLSGVGKLSTNQFSVALPGALLEAFLTDATTRQLQRPQVRVTDGGKGVLKIGSKIPYVSGSLNSAVATPGSIPYATTQFQQIDVGVNIDLQPHVNGPQDISMHIKVEVSAVTMTETIAGVQQPVIGQRVSEADLRMQDGEASLLGGLTQNSESSSAAGIPGITNIPILGYLFGTHTKDREKDDIVIALIPHIVRAPVVNNDMGILAGTERVVRVDRTSGEQASATVPGAMAPGVVPPAVQPGVPVGQPGNPTTPPTALPPLGRALELPPGVVPGQTTASGAYVNNFQPLPSRMTNLALPGAQDRSLVPRPQAPQPVETNKSILPNGNNNSIEIYLAPSPNSGPVGPQAAPDPNFPNHPFNQPTSINRRPIDPNAPLELTTVVVNDSGTTTTSGGGSSNNGNPASSSSTQPH